MKNFEEEATYNSLKSIIPTLSDEEYMDSSREKEATTLSHIKGEISDEEYLDKAKMHDEIIRSISKLLGKDPEVLRRLLIRIIPNVTEEYIKETIEHEIAHAKKYEERNLDWCFGILRFTDNNGALIRPFVFGDLKEETMKWSPIERIKFLIECKSAPENLSDGDEGSLKFWEKQLEEFENK